MKTLISRIFDSILFIALLALVPFAHARLSKPEPSVEKLEQCVQENNQSLEIEPIAQEPVSDLNTKMSEEEYTEPKETPVLEKHIESEKTTDKKKLSQRLHHLARVIEKLEAVVQDFESLEDIENL